MGTALRSSLIWLLVVLGACSRTAGETGTPTTTANPMAPRIAVLEHARVPDGAIARVATRFAFLPMSNRGKRALHPMLLEGPSQTLAAYAHVRLGSEIVRPDVVETLLREAGRPEWFEVPSSFPYDEALLERISDRTGAGVIVWTEIAPDDSIVLHSRAMTPTASADAWEGSRLAPESTETIERHVFDAPRRLIEAIAPKLARFEYSTPPPPEPGSIERALEVARAEMWTGRAGPMRRAEHRLAELALRHPDQLDPWLELAFLRVLRAMVLGDEIRSELMIDGPNVARHFARTFGDLDPARRARLDFIDHAYVGEADSETRYFAFIDGLPADAPERTLLSWLQEREPKARFSIPAEDLPGPLGAALTRMTRIPGRDAQREWAWQLLEDEKTRGFALGVPIVAHHIRRHADTLNKWTLRMGIRRMDLPEAAEQGVETWRASCDSLSDPRRARCASIIESWLRIFDPAVEVTPESLSQAAYWEALETRLHLAFIEAKLPADVAASLSPDSILRKDPGFGGVFHMLERYLESSNRIAALVDDEGPVLRASSMLLATEARRMLAGGIDLMIYTAEQPREIGQMRGQRDEWEPYAEALEAYPERVSFRDAMEAEAWIRQRSDGQFPPYREAMLFADHHPYDMNYLSVAHKLLAPAAKKKRAERLEALVPRVGRIVAEVHNLRLKGGDPELALRGLEQQMAYRPDLFAVEIRDKALLALKRPAADRLKAMLEGEKSFPRGAGLDERIARLAVELERFELAGERYELMRGEPNREETGCQGLVEIARRRGDLDEAEAIRIGCATESRDNFAAARSWEDVALLRRDHGRLAEALEAIQAGEERVGGAGFILTTTGTILELMGDYERAEAAYRSLDSIYEGNHEGRLKVALLALRRGRPQEAVTIVRELAKDERFHDDGLGNVSRRAFLAADDMQGFREFAAQIGRAGLVSLAEAEWDVAQDLPRATKLLDQAMAVNDDCACVPSARARILGEAGRYTEAAEAAQLAHDREGSDRTLAELLRAKLAAGDTEWIRGQARDGDPWSTNTWFARALASVIEGDLQRAREQIGSASARLYPTDPSGEFTWAKQLRPLLLYEASLVGRAGRTEDDTRLARDLELVAFQIDYDARLWQALEKVRRQLGDPDGEKQAHDRVLALLPYRNPAMADSRPGGEASPPGPAAPAQP